MFTCKEILARESPVLLARRRSGVLTECGHSAFMAPKLGIRSLPPVCPLCSYPHISLPEMEKK